MASERKLALRRLIERCLIMLGRSFDPAIYRWTP